MEDGAEIRRDTIISPHVYLAEGSRTGGSIVMEKTEIKKGAVVGTFEVYEGENKRSIHSSRARNAGARSEA